MNIHDMDEGFQEALMEVMATEVGLILYVIDVEE